ncbi:hypothetical protein HF295_04410 [Hujiaoplasma nucleasis]|uniref:Uncharacterized protein n=1 Tax=Hujiaoplasma nucleasis TaxID=2725268 RepID=A0A7L6N6L1_9MOLU|nr:hypothetical protein [Hujiaoplasma nucleasis]QLY40144.1 hypothetical protein HF295_04410 [Hujiaoplasma nucleasis]
MKTASKVLGIISFVLTIFIVIFMISSLMMPSTGGDGWEDLGLLLMAIVFIVIALILTIPMLIFLKKLKQDNMNFYLKSQIALIVVSIINFIFTILRI